MASAGQLLSAEIVLSQVNLRCSLARPDMNAAARTQLAPPGAGIPAAELAVARLMFLALRVFKDREWANRRFHTEAGRMLKLTRGLMTQAANAPVLIPRITGIEDSSRNWSPLMTLDHLVIVDRAVIEIIEHLAAERLYLRSIAIADTKPKAQQTLETVTRFAQVTQDYLARVSNLVNLRSAARHRHPWFGPLDAYGWHLLAAAHHSIHRRQIERIIHYGNKVQPP